MTAPATAAPQIRFVLVAVFVLVPFVVEAEDVVELVTGAKARGTVKSYSGTTVVVEVKVGKRKFTRRYPKSRVKSLTVNGKRIDLKSSGGSTSKTTSRPGRNDRVTRSRAETLNLIDDEGRTPPDWFESTPLNYPKTLDLSWPMPAPKGWNNQKNVGQFIWDRINPNQNKWREGVKLMHHILSTSRSRDVQVRAMQALGNMYHNLHEDYARAAFWLRQSGLERNLSSKPHAAMQLANCYWQLGSKPMAMDLLKKMPRQPYATIKLLGDMGETNQAVRLAERFSGGNRKGTVFLYAGDACRVAGRLTEAERYYRKAISAIPSAELKKPHGRREKARAEASIAALRFYSLDPKKVKDGTYRASSIGYEGPVQTEVVVKAGRIESVRVTQHREKQYYSSLTDTPRKILARQGVKGIDATSGATITSEAIINATAQALASGLK